MSVDLAENDAAKLHMLFAITMEPRITILACSVEREKSQTGDGHYNSPGLNERICARTPSVTQD